MSTCWFPPAGAVATPGPRSARGLPGASPTSHRAALFGSGDTASDRSDTFCGPIQGDMRTKSKVRTREPRPEIRSSKSDPLRWGDSTARVRRGKAKGKRPNSEIKGQPMAVGYLARFLCVWFALALLATGCVGPRPLKVGRRHGDRRSRCSGSPHKEAAQRQTCQARADGPGRLLRRTGRPQGPYPRAFSQRAGVLLSVCPLFALGEGAHLRFFQRYWHG